MRIEKKFERSTVNFSRMSFFFANERFWGSSMGRVDVEVRGALDHTRVAGRLGVRGVRARR